MRVAVLMLGVLLLLLLQAVEVWRRIKFPQTLTTGQFWRRLITAAVLQIVLLMWLVGHPLMDRRLPLAQLAYWTAALLFGIAAAFSAVREMGEVSRQYHRQRADLFRRVNTEEGETAGGGQERSDARGGTGRSGDRNIG